MTFPGNFTTENFTFINYTIMDEASGTAIWRARNHPDIRKYMTCPEPFSYGSHKAFIENLKSRKDRVFYAAISEGRVIGSICLNPYESDTKTGEMGKYLIPEYMGKGLGFNMAKEFLAYAFESGIVVKVTAKTFVTNLRNRHVNAKLGFTECKEDDTYVYMEKTK